MDPSQFNAIRRKLANVTESEETSTALRAYLHSAAERDVVDVIHEIEVLARILSDHAPEKSEP